EEKAQKRLEVKARSTLMMGIPNEHQLKFNSIKDAKLLMEAVEKRFETLDQTFDKLQKLMSQLELLGETISQEDVNQKLLRSLSPEWNTHVVVWRNKTDLDTMSMVDLYNNLKVYEPEVKGMASSSSSTQNIAFLSSSNNNNSSTNGTFCTAQAVNTANGVSDAQVNAVNIDNLSDAVIYDLEEMDLRWQMAMLTIRTRRFLKNTGRKLTINGNESVGFDKSKVECYNYHKKGHFAKECKAPRNQDYKNKESTRRHVHVETSTSTALVSCNGIGGYDWSDQAEEGPNYALMDYSSSSSDSEGNQQMDLQDQGAIDSRCSRHMTENMSYLTDYEEIDGGYVLKFEIECKDIAIRELKKKLEIAQKEKDGIQFNVEKFENASKSLNKLLKSQIVDNCKKGLGYNAVLPPYTGNFMPSIPDLSFNSLDEFVNKPVSDGEEESVSQTKTEKKTVKPSIAKIEFVKPKQHEKIVWKTVKQVDCNYHHKQFKKQRMVKPVWNNAQRVNHQNFAKKTHPYAKKNMVPGAVLMKSSLVLVNTARQVNVAHTKTTVNAARLMVNTVKDKNINIVRPKAVVNAVRPKAVVNVVKGNNVNAVKASACWVW
ncbi:ribonuclease H-like domain-containing protein, partial [Tanacetum coccineum]